MCKGDDLYGVRVRLFRITGKSGSGLYDQLQVDHGGPDVVGSLSQTIPFICVERVVSDTTLGVSVSCVCVGDRTWFMN